MIAATKRIGGEAATVLLTIVAWLAATAWLRPLMLPDEGRYVGVAWEMLRSGDWLTPTLDGLPFFHKPPLFYWITAASLSAFGMNEWAARAAPLLGGGSLAFALYLFVRRWFDRQVARATLGVLLTQPLFFIGSQFANLDMLVAGCIGITVLLLAHVVLCDELRRSAAAALMAAYAFAALGVLAKGLIGVLLPALVVLAWLLAMRRVRQLAALWSWRGALLWLAIVLPWFVAMQQRYPGFAHYFFVVQHFQRFSAGGFNNVQPFWFYPVLLALLGLPWVAWLLPVRHLAWWRDPVRGPLRWLMVLWLLVVVGFFSLPESKLIGYVLPALPPLSVLVADAALSPALRSAGRTRWWLASAALASFACVAAVATLSLLHLPSSRPLAQVLRDRRAAGEPVIFLGQYFYDLAFYARLREPALVVEEWASPDIAQHDNWRKELADAASFAGAAAADVLLTPDRLSPSPCPARPAWIIATDASAARYPWLAASAALAHSGKTGLWKIDPVARTSTSEPDCRGMPNDVRASR